MEFLKRLGLGLFVSAVVLLALVLGGLRVAINHIEYFKPEIEYLLTGEEASEIVFTALSGDMNGFNPVLRIDNVSLNLADRSQPLFIDRLEVEFDFWASLRQWQPVALEIAGQLERIELLRDPAGRWWIYESEIGGGEPVVMSELREALALVPRYVKLDLRRLILRDRKIGMTHQIERVEAHIDHAGDQYFVQASAALPDYLGTGLLLKSEIGSDRSLVYVNTSNLQLKPVADLLGIDTWGLQEGALDGEAWFNLAGFEIVAINGNLVLKQGVVQTSAEKTPVKLEYHARFSALNRRPVWRISNRFERLQVNGEYVHGFNAQIEVRPASGSRNIAAWVDRLDLSSLPAMAAQVLPARLNEQIEQGRLRGLLEDLALSVDLENPETFKASGRVSRINSEPVDFYPGVKNLSAEITAAGGRLGISLAGDRVSLDFGDQFRGPLEFDRLRLAASLQTRDDGLVLRASHIEASNPDLNFEGRAWLEVDGPTRPFMYLRGHFTDVQASSKSKYFPVKILPEKTLRWLDRGIKNGRVTEGDALFHGRLQDFRELQRNRSGEFMVDFRIEDSELMFAPGWLHARNGDGRFRFYHTSLEFDMDRVSYDQLDNARVRGRIADFSHAALELQISTTTSTDTAVRTWLNTPVSEPYRDLMQKVEGFAGETRTDIKVRLPLTEHVGGRDVQVVVGLRDSSARAPDWGVELSEIDGQLQIDERTIAATRIKARYFGDPIEIDIAPDAAGTLVNVRGDLELRHLLNRLPEKYTHEASGRSDWRVRLQIAGAGQADAPYLRIDAASNLEGTAIGLPRPFAKAAASPRRMSVELDFFPRNIDVAAAIGNDIVTRGRINVVGGERLELDGLDLAFATPLRPRQTDGIRIYGYLPEIELDEWIQHVDLAEQANPALLRLVDLEVERIRVFGRSLDSVRLELGRAERQLIGTIDSSLLRGGFQLPYERSRQNPVLIDLEYLRIDKQPGASDFPLLRPDRLADFRFSCEALVVHDMIFNDVQIDGQRSDNAFLVDQFKMRRDQVFLTGNAKWAYDPLDDRHTSSVVVAIEGNNLGEAIAGLGFGDSMSNGRIDFDGGFTWSGPLYKFNLETLEGDAKLSIEEGVLNNVDPGSGRFVGLLSLSALPRRLSLDFSDVLIRGMEFDTITGSYHVADGNLYTKNTRMEGPAAKIRISGRTGILSRDYDQKIQVTPKIRQTLPVIGALSAGSTVGWGLLLLQNLFKKTIDKAVEVEYEVSGSWDDPKIELIKAVDENQKELPTIDR